MYLRKFDRTLVVMIFLCENWTCDATKLINHEYSLASTNSFKNNIFLFYSSIHPPKYLITIMVISHVEMYNIVLVILGVNSYGANGSVESR